MAMNPNTIMSDLRMKSDTELQQFAAMHKNDPFIFPLAFQESQTRQRLRSAQQAKMAGQEQPKVVDQSLQAMGDRSQVMSGGLPEDSGIAQLPADNIQGMAGGGIIAFEEGGEVPRFQNQGLVYAPYGAQAKPATEAEIAEFNRQRSQGFMGNLSDFVSKVRGMLPSMPTFNSAPHLQPTVVKETLVPNADKATATTQTSPLINKEPGVVDKAIERKKLEEEAAAKGKKLPAEPGLPSLNAALKQYESTVYKNSPDKATLQKEFTDIDKPVADAMRASINKESARLKTDKEQDFYMSLIEGGLAAAAGDSPNAIQNIAKGLSTGAASYKGALKDFRKATQENTKAEMELARYEATGKKDALKAYNEQIAKRDDRYAQGVAGIIQQNMASSAALSAAKLSRDTAGDYRNQSQVETIRKNIDAKLGDDPIYKFNAAKRAAEVERRLQIELQRYPGLVGYAGTPTTGGASGATNQGWGQAKVVQ